MTDEQMFAKGYLDIQMPKPALGTNLKELQETRDAYWGTFASEKADQFVELMMADKDEANWYASILRNQWRTFYCQMIMKGIIVQ